MTETLYLLMGFFALALAGRLLYVGYTALLARLAKAGAPLQGRAIPALLTGFSLCTLFILFMMGFCVAVAGFPLTLGSALLAGLLILLFNNLLLFVGYQVNRQMYRRSLDQQLMRQKQRTEAGYYQALEEQYDRQRVLIHDIRKHLAALRDLADRADNQGVARYVAQLEASPALQRKARICGNHLLDVVLCRCQEVCEGKGVAFTADVREGAADFMEQADITALFGNLLENAVEAATGSPGGYIELLADARPGSALTVTLVNTCTLPPEPDGKGGFLSRKAQKEQHGLGLKSIRSAIQKYSGSLRQYYEAETGLFHTIVLLQRPAP
ncbi:sensor histidine kinase [Acutalibacter caecimuris]|uniref:sensor histidine kinase n=1 Tax=Acutalibacter caecimuris TaxID=3093657 RepID=UPI002AC9C514|nr:GHKL domain-containing protein [Acutalibacter sp. M00118]